MPGVGRFVYGVALHTCALRLPEVAACCFSSSMSYTLERSSFIATSLFLSWLRSWVQKMRIPVGLWNRSTADSTCRRGGIWTRWGVRRTRAHGRDVRMWGRADLHIPPKWRQTAAQHDDYENVNSISSRGLKSGHHHQPPVPGQRPAKDTTAATEASTAGAKNAKKRGKDKGHK